MDGQVKLRGFRLELGEVEAVLAAVDGVQDAVAVLQVACCSLCLLLTHQYREMQRNSPRLKAIQQCTLLASRLQDANMPTAVLVAYVTPETADEAALLAAAHAKLPAYMEPSAIVRLAELPRLASGKVCWRLLSKVRPVPVPQRLASVFIQTASLQ